MSSTFFMTSASGTLRPASESGDTSELYVLEVAGKPTGLLMAGLVLCSVLPSRFGGTKTSAARAVITQHPDEVEAAREEKP